MCYYSFMTYQISLAKIFTHWQGNVIETFNEIKLRISTNSQIKVRQKLNCNNTNKWEHDICIKNSGLFLILTRPFRRGTLAVIIDAFKTCSSWTYPTFRRPILHPHCVIKSVFVNKFIHFKYFNHNLNNLLINISQ